MRGAYEGIAPEYTHPRQAGHAYDHGVPSTIRPGEHLQARRTTGSAVFCVVQGRGTA